jgi:hypothetical protein
LSPVGMRALTNTGVVLLTLLATVLLAAWMLRRIARPVEALAGLARRATDSPEPGHAVFRCCLRPRCGAGNHNHARRRPAFHVHTSQRRRPVLTTGQARCA